MFKLTATLIFALLPVSALADPTFNGSFEKLGCNPNQMVVCEGDYCRPDSTNTIKGNVVLDYVIKQAVINDGKGNLQVPIEIVAQSEPVLGKPLWVRSRIPYNNKTLNIQTTYIPQQGGAYNLFIGIQTKSPQTVEIMSGGCGIQQRPKQ